jgi:hypothetical protein
MSNTFRRWIIVLIFGAVFLAAAVLSEKGIYYEGSIRETASKEN